MAASSSPMTAMRARTTPLARSVRMRRGVFWSTTFPVRISSPMITAAAVVTRGAYGPAARGGNAGAGGVRPR